MTNPTNALHPPPPQQQTNQTHHLDSLRNQLLVATDWVRTKVFGRDISRF